MRTSVHMLRVSSILICATAVAVTGCSPAYYKSSADREVYGIIKQKSPKVTGMPGAFSIGQARQDFLSTLPVAQAPQAPAPQGAQAPQTEEAGKVPPAPGAAPTPAQPPQAAPAAAPTPGAPAPAPSAQPPQAAQGAQDPADPPAPQPPATPAEVRALQAAGEAPAPPAQAGQAGEEAAETTLSPEARQALRSPDEDEVGAYIVTLDKALEIATLNSRDYQTQKETLYQTGLALTFQRYQFVPHFFGIVTGNYEATGLGDDQQVSAGTNLGFNWLLATGATVSTSLSTTVSKFLTGQPREAASSLFNLAITQPILQGAGIAVTEPLTQAERNVLYQIRSFVEFRRSFFVTVLSQYYRVLQQRQILLNQIENYRGQLTLYGRSEWMGRAGQMAQYEVDQSRQSMLSAELGVVEAHQSYQNALDQFKITLALPTEARIVLDPQELQRLELAGVSDVGLTEDRIMEIALERRLDLLVARDSVDDAARKVQVGENELLPLLNLSASLNSATASTQPLKFTSDNTNAGAGFELDLPLDRLSQRNDYRSKLIAFAQAQRQFGLTRDQVVQDVRNDLRDYITNKRSYEVQVEALRLAQTRVDSTTLLLEAGRVLIRDVLDARSSLLSAQNSLAQAIVAFKVASVSLARDMDILMVGDKGQLKEGFDEYK